MVKRRADGTLRQTASMRDYNWQKPQTPERAAITEFFIEHDRPPTDEEREEIERSLATDDSDA